MKKIGIVLAALLIAAMIATSVSAHTMRGIEFTIDSPNPEPVITIITHDTKVILLKTQRMPDFYAHLG